MTCGKTAHLAMEFTFTPRGQCSSTSLNLLNIHPQLPRGTQDTGESGSHRRTRQYNSQPRTELFFFFFCKFETYVNVISNHNSCCKSDSSNFCCMILFFVKCNCPCTKCSYLIMNCFKSLSKLQKLFGLCDAAHPFKSGCVWTWDRDRESSSHVSQTLKLHTIMENNSKILQSRTSGS